MTSEQNKQSGLYLVIVLTIIPFIFIVISIAHLLSAREPDTSYKLRHAEVSSIVEHETPKHTYYSVKTSAGDTLSVSYTTNAGQKIIYWCNAQTCVDERPMSFNHAIFWPVLTAGLCLLGTLIVGALAIKHKL